MIDLKTRNNAIFDLNKFDECRTVKARELDEHFKVPDVVDVYSFRSSGSAGFKTESYEVR